MTSTVPRSDTALAAWQALTDRQRAYLTCAYQVDQEREAAEGRAWARGGRRRPAAEWRWLRYGDEWGGASALLRRVQERGLADTGAGATWAALDRRGLIERRYQPGGGQSGPVSVEVVDVR